MDMTGKTVVITGASRGIGAEAARVFAAAGANVALLARSIDTLAAQVNDIGAQARAYVCDVADYDQLASAITATHDQFGSIDVLINNAGTIEPISHLGDADPAGWSHTIDINLKGVFYGMRAVVPLMRAQGAGTVLSVSSGAAHGPVEAWSHYCSAKAGAAMLTRCLDKEERANGIRAIGLSPGTVATQMQREIKSSGINPVSQLAWEDHIPADWPARALLWMCSPAADAHLGGEISLREPAIRTEVGLT